MAFSIFKIGSTNFEISLTDLKSIIELQLIVVGVNGVILGCVGESL